MVDAKLILGVILEKLAEFWRKLVKWIRKVFDKIQQLVKRAILGAESFLKRVGDVFQEVMYTYTKNDEGKWRKDTVVKQKMISADEVPPELRQKAWSIANGQMLDTTDALTEQLMLANS